MDHIATIREFHTANFTVRVDALVEYDLDLSFDDTGEVLEKLESGEFVAFCARATVHHRKLGELSSDYLGGCIYRDFGEFENHREAAAYERELRAQGEDVRVGSYFTDMVRTAISEAREAIRESQNIHVRRAA